MIVVQRIGNPCQRRQYWISDPASNVCGALTMRKSSHEGVMTWRFSGREKNSNIVSIGLGSHCSRSRQYSRISPPDIHRIPREYRIRSSEGLTSASKSGKKERSMTRWNVKAPTLLILSCLVFIMLLIVVLPDVDLPDTAFRRGPAPLVVHVRAKTVPPTVAVAALFQFPKIAQFWRPDRDL